MSDTTKKILIAEDDGFIAEVYFTKLSSLGYKVAIAADGQETLDSLKNNKYDLLLLDIMMPKVNGLVVLEKIATSAELEDLPVIVLTNAGDKENVDKALSLGAKGFLVKSNFTPEEVVAKVKEILK